MVEQALIFYSIIKHMRNKHKKAFTLLNNPRRELAARGGYLMGFTLIEILVVIAIIGIISVLVLVIISAAKNKARITKAKAQMSKIIEVAILTQGETGKFLKDITGSPCSDCGWCPPISVGVTCRNRDLRNIPESDGCFKCWKSAITKIQAASGNGIELNIDKFLRDPWGSPYCLDENEGEWNWWDTICSAGPDGVYNPGGSSNDDNICFKIPYAKK